MGGRQIQIIVHRVNSSTLLREVEKHFGIEIDLRSKNGEIILAHDPIVDGESLENFMASFSHKMLILNVKEDGLEEQILAILKNHNSPDYFFLDQPFPTLAKSLKLGHQCAMRVSEYELPFKLLQPQPQWLWIDSITGNWDHIEGAINYAKANRIKSCLVSPELHGRDPKSEIEYKLMRHYNEIDFVCTKIPTLWCA